MKASVIIPAHNEEKTIADTLVPLIAGVENGFYEIIVICNGCSDNTVGIVESFGNKIRLIETDIASKTNALNLGDKVAQFFPRIYLDADIVISIDTLNKIVLHLSVDQNLATAPKMKMDLRNSSYFVRAYYDVWQRLPYVKEGMIGVGIYALSRLGRQRFTSFPEIISDDGYVRALFKKEERKTVKDCYSLVTSPMNIKGLIYIKTRSRRGVYELKTKFPELQKNEIKDYKGGFRQLTNKIEMWPKIAIYLIINLISRIRANISIKPNKKFEWERDESSRIR